MSSLDLPETDGSECRSCNKNYSNKKNLKCHVKTFHLKEKAFKCQYCPFSFINKSYFQDHVQVLRIFNISSVFDILAALKKCFEVY